MNRFFHIGILLILFCCSVFAQEKNSLGKETRYDSIIASVNGEAVTLLDILLESTPAEARLAALYTGDKLESEVEKVRRKSLDEIVTRKMVYMDFKKRPFEIPTQYVENYIDYLAVAFGNGTRESLEAKARQMGVGMDELREKAKEKIAVDVIMVHHCERMVNITPKEVYDEYEKRIVSMKKPASVKLRIMQLPRKKRSPKDPDPVKMRDQLASMIRNADSEFFSDIVKANTQGPNANNGGDMGWIEVPLLRTEFASALKDPVKGANLGPVETEEGWYFIHVDDVRKEEIPSFESVSASIESELKKIAVEKIKKEYTEKISKNAIVSYYF